MFYYLLNCVLWIGEEKRKRVREGDKPLKVEAQPEKYRGLINILNKAVVYLSLNIVGFINTVDGPSLYTLLCL